MINKKLSAVVVIALGPISVLAQAATMTASAAVACQALQSVDLSDLQDAPTQLTASKMIARSGDRPEYCEVDGYVAPQVGFQLRLPISTWNGKFLAIGNGGWGGTFDGNACNGYLKRGYACVISDTGHKGQGDDGLWARHNLSAQIDFGYRGTHVAALAGKAVVEHFYSRAPQRSYFTGCSTGGYEGLVEAQRFPSDFDGIVAGAPDMDELAWVMRSLWSARNIQDKSGQPIMSANHIQLLHRAVLDACDKDDGVKDGLVGNPLACKFDVSTLACKGANSSQCLTYAQVEAVKRIYAGPMTSAGIRTATGGVLPGSELSWNDPLLGLGAPALRILAESLLRDMTYGANPEWKASEFDFDRDYQRLGLGALYMDTNPDLRKFKAAGGKLIVYQGANDLLNQPSAIVDYFQTTERTMGGREPTEEFFRLFLVPGMGHCTGGAGAYAIDYLSYLETWVEKGKAPDAMIGAHVSDSYLAAMPIDWTSSTPLTPELKALVAPSRLQFPLDPTISVSFTRPVYPFPDYAVFNGTGSASAAGNFERHVPPGLMPPGP
jgi:hypothetical protein